MKTEPEIKPERLNILMYPLYLALIFAFGIAAISIYNIFWPDWEAFILALPDYFPPDEFFVSIIAIVMIFTLISVVMVRLFKEF